MSDTPGQYDFRASMAHLHNGYRGAHVSHGPPDTLVDDVVTWRMIVPHLLRAAFFFLVPLVVTGVLYLFVALVSLGEFASGSRSSVGSSLSVIVSILGFGFFVLAVVVLFFPLKEPIAEYSQLVEGRAWVEPAAYWWIATAANENGITFRRWSVLVGRSPVMFFRHGHLEALITVRQYGQHLFLGWTMWRSRSTIVLIGHFLRDTFGRLSPSGGVRAELRASEARAMREIVHSLVREGVQAAILTEAGRNFDSIQGFVVNLPHLESSAADPFRT